jgi:hypothetical protein
MGIRLFSSMCRFMSLNLLSEKQFFKQEGQSRIPNNSDKTTKEHTVEINQHL